MHPSHLQPIPGACRTPSIPPAALSNPYQVLVAPLPSPTLTRCFLHPFHPGGSPLQPFPGACCTPSIPPVFPSRRPLAKERPAEDDRSRSASATHTQPQQLSDLRAHGEGALTILVLDAPRLGFLSHLQGSQHYTAVESTAVGIPPYTVFYLVVYTPTHPSPWGRRGVVGRPSTRWHLRHVPRSEGTGAHSKQ